MKENYIDALSIVIPTYNRPNELKRLLQSIFREDLSKVYEIVIVNNCSDYQIESVTNEFDSDRIKIQNNPFNVKMSTNMMNGFLHCKTKWMWLISDDDDIIENSIEVILERIKYHEDSCLLKFSTSGIVSGREKNLDINSIEDLINYYEIDNFNRRGNFIFLSNGVYNLKKLYPYLGFGYEYSYTFIPFVIPVLFALKEKEKISFSDIEIIQYNHPESDWSKSKIGLGLSTLFHIDFGLSLANKCKLLNFLMIVNFKSLFIYLVKFNINNSKQIFDIIYHSSFKYFLNPLDKLKCYFCSFLLNFPTLMNKIYTFFKN